MEGYKSFKDAVKSVEGTAKSWRSVSDAGDIFSYDELLDAADIYDKAYEPDGWNYFVSFPTGEVGVLSTDDNEIVLMFTPEGKEKTEHKASRVPRFCKKCGRQLKPTARFCIGCGAEIKKHY